MSKFMRILLGGLLLALMSANFAINIYSMLTPPRPPEGGYDGMVISWNYKGEPRVTSVDPDGPATEFKIGAARPLAPTRDLALYSNPSCGSTCFGVPTNFNGFACMVRTISVDLTTCGYCMGHQCRISGRRTDLPGY